MKVTRFYTGDDNRSHFQDLEIPTPEIVRNSHRSAPLPVEGMLIRESAGDAHFLELHPAPRRQFILCLTGIVEIELGTGEKRQFGPGEVYLADDLTGEGHIHREVQGPLLHAWVFLPSDYDIGQWEMK